MNRKYKDVYDGYKFLATTPTKIDTALIVALFSLIFVIFGIDFCRHVFANLLSIGFIIINVITFLSCFIYIANLKEVPDSTDFMESQEFNYRKSLKMTRLIQQELAESFDGMIGQRQKENNSLRLLSFVVVFRRKAYLFIRQSKKVENRTDYDFLMMVANDIADNLNLSVSSFQPLTIRNNIGLGHYYFQTFQVMQLR